MSLKLLPVSVCCRQQGALLPLLNNDQIRINAEDLCIHRRSYSHQYRNQDFTNIKVIIWWWKMGAAKSSWTTLLVSTSTFLSSCPVFFFFFNKKIVRFECTFGQIRWCLAGLRTKSESFEAAQTTDEQRSYITRRWSAASQDQWSPALLALRTGLMSDNHATDRI